MASRGTEDSVSFPKPVRRILLNLEPSVFQQAFPDSDTGRDVELIEQWGVRDPQLEYILRALEADLEAGVRGEGCSETPCSVRSLCIIFNALML